MKMLKCFGKCSRDTYIVNKPSKTQSIKQDTRNGGPKIIPLPSEAEPANGKPHKDETKKIAPSPPKRTLQLDEPTKPNGNIVQIEDNSKTSQSTLHESDEQRAVHEVSESVKDEKSIPQENITPKNEENQVRVEVGSASNSTVEHSTPSTNFVENDEKEPLYIETYDDLPTEPIDSNYETNISVIEQDTKTVIPSLITQTELQKSNDTQITNETNITKESLVPNEHDKNTNKEVNTLRENLKTEAVIEVNVTKENVTRNEQDTNTAKETERLKESPVIQIPNEANVTKESVIQNEQDKIINKEINTPKENLAPETANEANVTKENVIQNEQDTNTVKETNRIKDNSVIQIANKANTTKESVVRSEQDKHVIRESNRLKENAVHREEVVVMKSGDIKEDSAEDDEEVYVDVTQLDLTNDLEEKKRKGENTKKVRIGNVEIEPTEIKKEIEDTEDFDTKPVKRRSGIVPLPVKYDESSSATLPNYPKDPDDEVLIRKAIESNDFLNKIISGKRLDAVIGCMYNKEISAKETIIKQGEKGSHMYVSAKGNYQVLVKGKPVGAFNDVRVFGELAILYNAKRLASIKAVTSGRVWVLDRNVYQQIMVRDNIKEQDEIMEFLMNNQKLNVVGKAALQEVANLLKSEFFSAGKQIVRQGDKGHKFYIIRAGTVTITKDGEGVVGNYKKGDCFGELALLKEDSRQATVTADPPAVECLTLTRKEFIAHFGELGDLTEIKARPQDSIKAVVSEHEDINLTDLKIIKTLGVGGFGRVELVQHTKKKDLVFALKYLKKIDIVLQHQQEHVYNEKNIQMASKSPFIVRLYRTYKDSKYIYLLMESCLGGDLWSLLQKQRLRRFEEKEARFISACVLEAFDYLHSRGIIYRDLKPENLLIAANGYIKLTDFGFAKKISSRGRTFTFAGTPEYVAPEIVLNKGHDRAVDYWAFGAFIFEMLTGRTPFRTDDSSHMKTYNKILNGIDNIQFPNYVNSKARHIVGKLCRPVPVERLGMQKDGIKDIKAHRWFLGFDWLKFAKCEVPSPFRPKLKSAIDTQHFDPFKKDSDIPPDELSGWDIEF